MCGFFCYIISYNINVKARTHRWGLNKYVTLSGGERSFGFVTFLCAFAETFPGLYAHSSWTPNYYMFAVYIV